MADCRQGRTRRWLGDWAPQLAAALSAGCCARYSAALDRESYGRYLPGYQAYQKVKENNS